MGARVWLRESETACARWRAAYPHGTNPFVPTHAARGAGAAGEAFSTMAVAYWRTGGLMTSDELLCLVRQHADQPISRLARWIVTRQVVSFTWQSHTLLPMFQFDPADMALRAGPREVTLELAGAFDSWDLASWFAQPNAWLQGEAPVDVIARDQPSVLRAARADRFIAAG
jgi:hypothetical protein